MKKIITKLFALDYLFKNWNGNRGAFIVIPTALLYGLALTFNLTLQYPLLFLLAVVTFFDFIYFLIWPIRWVDLDDSQKWQYGIAVKSGSLTHAQSYYTDIDWLEWEDINKQINKTHGTSKHK